MDEPSEAGPAAPGAPPGPERLPRARLALYALPAAGVGFMLFLVSVWFLKFSTDVLLLPPAAIAALFAAARLWDAVIDPLAGWLSDRTRTRFGRRRPWMAASAFATPVAFVLLFNPPQALAGPVLLAWGGVALFAFYAAATAFHVPHQALGAELSNDPRERTWIFGFHYVAWQLGAVAALVTVSQVTLSEAPRGLVAAITLPLAALSALLVLACVAGVGERPENQGRGGHDLRAAFRDVGRNPHARPLLLAYFVDSIGMATVAVLAPYVAEYLLGGPELLLSFFVFYMVPAVTLAPLWPGLAARLGKKNLWVASMLVGAGTFAGFWFLPEGQVWGLRALAALVGAATGCAQVIVPSLQADVVDWDEHETGQRKEGAYFAARTFLFKSAFGVMVMVTGATLEWVGYAPGQAQSPETLTALRVLFCALPAACYLAGALYVIPRFRFDAADHARLRSELDRRRDASR